VNGQFQCRQAKQRRFSRQRFPAREFLDEIVCLRYEAHPQWGALHWQVTFAARAPIREPFGPTDTAVHVGIADPGVTLHVIGGNKGKGKKRKKTKGEPDLFLSRTFPCTPRLERVSLFAAFLERHRRGQLRVFPRTDSQFSSRPACEPPRCAACCKALPRAVCWVSGVCLRRDRPHVRVGRLLPSYAGDAWIEAPVDAGS